jgi:hypothetical protein
MARRQPCHLRHLSRHQLARVMSLSTHRLFLAVQCSEPLILRLFATPTTTNPTTSEGKGGRQTD